MWWAWRARGRWLSSSSPSPSPSPSSAASCSPLLTFRLMHAMTFRDAIATLNQHLARVPPPAPAPPAHPAEVRLARFQPLYKYVETLDMEESLSRLSVIHVAGTKGKGSTCAFAESILRSCGYRTGLFTSPHLVDICERFRFNGANVSKEVFAKHFWWCWERLQSAAAADLPMPGFFPFLTLLALKMFTMENIDVAILEVGLGGRLDPTNIIRRPVVCGVTSLGFDHMEILGNTLAEIASEKAGIFKAGVPAFSVPQQPEAMEVLQRKAESLSIPFSVAPALETYVTDHIQLGLEGEHQRVNAALAVALCSSWEKSHGALQNMALLEQGRLPEAYLHGLATTSWPGRGQIIHDVTQRYENISGQTISSVESAGAVTFFLDGAHSPESMEACAKWFTSAVTLTEERNKDGRGTSGGHKIVLNGSEGCVNNGDSARTSKRALQSQKVLLFNCMPKRDPELLLQHLVNTFNQNGLHISMALFVPTFSSTKSIDTRTVAEIYSNSMETTPDLSWQKILQNIWESLQPGTHKELTTPTEYCQERLYDGCVMGSSSAVMPSLPAALSWLRHRASENSVHIQVLVTGSLYLVGDLLKLLTQSQESGSSL